jgi:hypothetical protein
VDLPGNNADAGPFARPKCLRSRSGLGLIEGLVNSRTPIGSRVRWAALVTLLELVIAPGELPAQTATTPELSSYAVLGIAGVTVRAESRVTFGAVGSIEGTLRIGREARVSNVAAAPTVRVGAASHTGTVFCHLVSGPPPLPSCTAFIDPLVDPTLLTPVTVVPGASDLRLPAHTGTEPIPAGSFRNVRVGAGSVLQLAGGAYAARSLRVGHRAQVVCATDCRIGVLGSVRVGRAATLGAASPARANSVRLDIASSDGLPAFVARRRARVSATIFAPAGDVLLAAHGAHRGAFVGRTVVVGPGTTVRGDSAL